jgi:hypothetical protein
VDKNKRVSIAFYLILSQFSLQHPVPSNTFRHRRVKNPIEVKSLKLIINVTEPSILFPHRVKRAAN